MCVIFYNPVFLKFYLLYKVKIKSFINIITGFSYLKLKLKSLLGAYYKNEMLPAWLSVVESWKKFLTNLTETLSKADWYTQE